MWLEYRSSEPVRGLDLHQLGLDEAYINVSSRGIKDSIWLYSLRSQCQKCPYQLVGSVPAETDHILKLSSHFSWQFRVFNQNLGNYISASDNSEILCGIEEPWNIGEFGIYDLEVRSKGQQGEILCNKFTYLEAVNVYIPMVLISIATILLLLGYLAVEKYMQKKDSSTSSSEETDELKAKIKEEKLIDDKVCTLQKRNHAIDTFRGICMFIMVFYNSGWGGYLEFSHIPWNGLFIADIPFPWFIWIMGMCIPISINSMLKKNICRYDIFKSILKRSILLFLVGVSISSYEYGTALETMRIMNALQRFGLLCFISGTLCCICWPRNISHVKGELRDIRILAPQWIVNLILHSIYLSLTFFLPVPGCPTGYLGPGGLHDDRKYVNCTGGAAGYVDRLILPVNNLYNSSTPKELYQTSNFEPEGIYSTLPTLLSVILGMQAGATLMTFDTVRCRVRRWCIWGLSCLLIGLLLSLTDAIPINKNLWSTSLALVTSGLGFLALALCYIITDGWNIWTGVPFTYYGRNSILAYIGTKLTSRIWPWYWQYGRMDTHSVLWMNACWNALLWFFTLRELNRRKIYIKL